MTTNYPEGPLTRVSLFDLESARVSEFKKIEQGFAGDFRFEGRLFVYKRHYYGTGTIREVEVDIDAIENWKAVALRGLDGGQNIL